MYTINIWFLLYSWEPYGDSELATCSPHCVLWACGHDWQAIARTTHITKQPGAPPLSCAKTITFSAIYFQREETMHVVLMMLPRMSNSPCSPHEALANMKMLTSCSAVIRDRASEVTPELGRKNAALCSLTAVWYCYQTPPLCSQPNSVRSRREMQLGNPARLKSSTRERKSCCLMIPVDLAIQGLSFFGQWHIFKNVASS